jgi:Kef-type K+ transport system membrane component KefB
VKTALTIGNLQFNVASRVRRRWVVAAIYTGFAVLVTAWFLWGSTSRLAFLALPVFYVLAGLLIGGRHNAGLVPSYAGGDERERTRRYRAHYVAYNWLDLLSVPALFAAIAINSPAALHAGPTAQMLVSRLAWALLIAVGILYYTLPQAILLWTEPDMEAQQ